LLVHLNNVSGGVLAGDRLRLDVEVDPGEIAQITTTGATRLYRHRPGAADSEQYTVISVGEGALMEYLPDAVIPYAGSRHTQRTEIKLASGAVLFWWEVLAPGRQAAGERFAFERLRVESEVRAGTRPVVRERFLLEPAARPLDVMARMQQYLHVASFYACQEGRPSVFWRALESQLSELARERTQFGEVVWGASMLASDGVIVRGLSASSRWIHPAMIEFWRQARLAVTGQEAIPPRKIS
jgi:urease accessory protein